MSAVTNILIALGLVACLGLSFVLSGMEAGVFALSRLRIRRLMRAGQSSAKVLHQFLENPENFLWTIVVGNTLVNFVVLGWFFSLLHSVQVSLRSGWFALWFVITVSVFYTFFDLLPKMLFRTYPNRLCLLLARPFRVLHIGLRPLVVGVEWCARRLLHWTGGRKFSGHLFGNREELREATRESDQVFSSEERAMIIRVLDLENIPVRQIIKPLSDAVMIEATASIGEAWRLFRDSSYTRLPVWQKRGEERRIVGILSADGLMYTAGLLSERPVREFVTPGLFLAEDLRLDVVLERMQRGGQRLAIVLGRDGREIGVVGLEDILKRIFGEVHL